MPRQKRFLFGISPEGLEGGRANIILQAGVDLAVMLSKRVQVLPILVFSIGLLVGCTEGGGDGPIVPPPPAPAAYADKHMPVEWWGDAQKLEEGRKLYAGEANPDVKCASCHGSDGKPVKAGATDFRNPERMKLYSDSVWFWRISEGVPDTKMKGWKSKLSEDDVWKLVLYERNFGLAGKMWSEEQKQWVGVGAK